MLSRSSASRTDTISTITNTRMFSTLVRSITSASSPGTHRWGDFGEKEAVLSAIANAHDRTERQITLVWLLQRSPVLLPIPGTSTIESLKSNIVASEIEFTDEEVSRLSA